MLEINSGMCEITLRREPSWEKPFGMVCTSLHLLQMPTRWSSTARDVNSLQSRYMS
jgi:hypothetical protein